jgi:archaellum component FlaC
MNNEKEFKDLPEGWKWVSNLKNILFQQKIMKINQEFLYFLGLIKKELYGKKNIAELSDEEIDALIELTKDIISLIEKETKKVDFWDFEYKQKILKGHIRDLLLEKESIFPNIYD